MPNIYIIYSYQNYIILYTYEEIREYIIYIYIVARTHMLTLLKSESNFFACGLDLWTVKIFSLGPCDFRGKSIVFRPPASFLVIRRLNALDVFNLYNMYSGGGGGGGGGGGTHLARILTDEPRKLRMRWTVHATRYIVGIYISRMMRVYRGVCRGPRTVVFLKIYRDEYPLHNTIYIIYVI